MRDAAATFGYGVEWVPGQTPEAPIMRQCRYDDVALGDRLNIRAFTADFLWQSHRWVKGPVVTSDYSNPARVPWQCMRFRVPGTSPAPMAVP